MTLRKTIKILAVLALVFFLFLGGGAVWLSSSRGLDFVLQKANQQLNNHGFDLSWAEISSPKPFSLNFHKLKLADGEGVW
ncbi:MAG: hypothetical protein ACRCTY_01520, partial [Candidatus Adiutrix sp.]